MEKLQFGEVWMMFPKLKQLITYKARTKINIFWIWTGSFRRPFSKDNQSQIKQLQSFVVRKMRRKYPGEKWSQNLENQEEMGNFPHPQVAVCRWVCTFAVEPEVWGHPGSPGVWCLWKERCQLAHGLPRPPTLEGRPLPDVLQITPRGTATARSRAWLQSQAFSWLI